jgi:hypothetical protein
MIEKHSNFHWQHLIRQAALVEVDVVALIQSSGQG